MISIQDDEAIESYLARGRLIAPETFDASGPLGGIGGHSTKDLRTLAAWLGWEGCFGFNKLLYLHTNYNLTEILHCPRSYSYSLDLYVSNRDINGVRGRQYSRIKLCSECVSTDMLKHGFFYWRRSQQGDVNVCVIHNRLLLDCCPHCGADFAFACDTRNRWQPCECSESSYDSADFMQLNERELKYARIRNEIYNFGYQIPKEYALEALKLKLKSMAKKSRVWSDHVTHLEYGDSHLNSLYTFMLDQLDWWDCCAVQLVDSTSLLYLISVMYESFAKFLGDINCPLTKLIPVSYKWSTYIIGHDLRGDNVFITENSLPLKL